MPPGSSYHGATENMAVDASEMPEGMFEPDQGTFGSAMELSTPLLPDGKVTLFKSIRSFCEIVEGRPAAEIRWARMGEIAAPIRKALVNGQIRVECLARDGSREGVEPTVFGEDLIWNATFSNPATMPTRPGGALREGHLIVGDKELNRFLPVGNAFCKAEAPYVPPLLAYILELAERFDLSPNYKFDKKAMQDALRKLVDEEPALRIGTKVGYIATLLGHPAFEAGGGGPGEAEKAFPSIAAANEAGINEDRPPRPDARYKSVQYPRGRSRKRGELGGLLPGASEAPIER